MRRMSVIRRRLWVLCTVCLLCLGLGTVEAEEALNSASLPLEDVILLKDITIPERNAKVTIHFAALPEKAGKILVLRFQMVSYAPTAAGCNFNARVTLNDSPLGRHTAHGTERVLGRAITFTFTETYTGEFPMFAG